MSPLRGQGAATAAGARLASSGTPGAWWCGAEPTARRCRWPCRSWRSAERKAPAGGSGRRWSSPRTTCTRVIPDCSHFVAGEAPRQLLAALIPLLTA